MTLYSLCEYLKRNFIQTFLLAQILLLAEDDDLFQEVMPLAMVVPKRGAITSSSDNSCTTEVSAPRPRPRPPRTAIVWTTLDPEDPTATLDLIAFTTNSSRWHWRVLRIPASNQTWNQHGGFVVQLLRGYFNWPKPPRPWTVHSGVILSYA